MLIVIWILGSTLIGLLVSFAICAAMGQMFHLPSAIFASAASMVSLFVIIKMLDNDDKK